MWVDTENKKIGWNKFLHKLAIFIVGCTIFIIGIFFIYVFINFVVIRIFVGIFIILSIVFWAIRKITFN